MRVNCIKWFVADFGGLVGSVFLEPRLCLRRRELFQSIREERNDEAAGVEVGDKVRVRVCAVSVDGLS